MNLLGINILFVGKWL